MTALRIALAVLLAFASAPGLVRAQQSPASPPSGQAATPVVRVAFIDPLSGAFANAGESSLRHFRWAFDELNARPGKRAYRYELLALDNKASPQESLTQLRAAIDQGARYVVQGQSSAAALALSDAIGRHNEREPARQVLFLNYAAADPDLTGSRCSFWHFRFDASSDMRLEAMASAIERDARVKAVYLIGQNYSFGQQVARTAREILARRRPDVRIVGDELHPLGQVKDFAPYVAKIRASGADTVVTGNWGNDLTLLVKAAREANLAVDFFTFYAGSLGAVTAIGDAGVGRVRQVSEWHANVASPATDAMARRYRDRFREDFYFFRIHTLAAMLDGALVAAGTDATRSGTLAAGAGATRSGTPAAGTPTPRAVAARLEGMRQDTPLGEVQMRASDHQLLQPMFVSVLDRVGTQGVRNGVEGQPLGFRTEARIEPWVTALPTTCAMQRP